MGKHDLAVSLCFHVLRYRHNFDFLDLELFFPLAYFSLVNAVLPFGNDLDILSLFPRSCRH